MPSSVEKSGYAVILSIIKAEDVIKIWTGCPERDLADHCFKKRIPCYLYHHSLQSPDGKIFHYCIPEWGPDDHGIPDVLDWAGIVFEMQDIKKFENEHPEYLWKAVSLDDCPSPFESKGAGNNTNDGRNINEEKLISTDPEWMPAHEARVVIGMTPINFVNFLNTGKLETDREQERLDYAKSFGWEADNVPFFKTVDLDTLRVHKASFAEYTEQLYVGRYMSDSILKYYESKGRTDNNTEVGYNKNATKSASPISDIIGTSEEWIGIDDARKMLQTTPKELLHLLNTGQIETSIEEDRAFSYNDYMTSPYTDRDFFFFTKDKIGKFLVNKISVKRYAENNSIPLIENKNCSTIDVNDEQVKARIAELERQLEELRQENEGLKADGSEVIPQASDCENCSSDQNAAQRLAVLETVNQDLQSRLDAALAGRPRWLPSSIALFQASKQVIESGREDWIKDEFFSLAESLYVNPGDNQGVLGEAREEAWKALPKHFKAGPGNQKNKVNPTKE